MIGSIIYKSKMTTKEQLDRYTSLAEWCNQNNATLIDTGKAYKVVQLPEKSQEEIDEENRQLRIIEIKERLAQLSYVSEEIILGLAVRDDYLNEIEEIASLHNELTLLEEMGN